MLIDPTFVLETCRAVACPHPGNKQTNKQKNKQVVKAPRKRLKVEFKKGEGTGDLEGFFLRPAQLETGKDDMMSMMSPLKITKNHMA